MSILPVPLPGENSFTSNSKKFMEKVQVKTNHEFKISGNWNKHSRVLQEKFPSLTDADLKFEHGKEGDLLTRIGKRINKKHDEVVNIINKVMETKV
jgi:uncharacterized protein YjbJ (UPF0337 family)